MLSRRLSRAVGVAVSGLLVGSLAVATPGPVNAVGVIEVAGACTLSDAIRAVNAQADSGGCINSPSPTNVIRLSSASGSFSWSYGLEVYNFVGAYLPGDRAHEGSLVGGARATLPDITRSTVIEGADRLTAIVLGQEQPPLAAGAIDRGARLLTTAPGTTLTLRNLILAGGRPIGSAENSSTFAADTLGGAVYAGGGLVLDNVHFTRNSASGSSALSFDGASARGGAVYANGDVVVTRSLFERNRVAGGNGGRSDRALYTMLTSGELPFGGNVRVIDGRPGGSAEGADIALAPGASLVATDSVFLRGSARGGSGAYGADGSDGSKGTRANAGRCENENIVGWAEAGDGQDGQPGGVGGDAGDAVGSIAGGVSVTLERAAIVGTAAVTGQAALAGMPGKGGAGGDGVKTPNCGASDFSSLFGTDATSTSVEQAGDGGNGGIASPMGDRGTAVSAIRSAQVLLSNVTITGTQADVLDDIPPTGGRTLDQYLREWRVIAEYSAPPGTPAEVDYYDPTGDYGAPAGGPTGSLEGSAPGRSAVIAGTQQTVVSFSTLVDNATVTPGDTGQRLALTMRPLIDGPALASSSILYNERNYLQNPTSCSTIVLRSRSVTGLTCAPTSTDGTTTTGLTTSPVSAGDQQLGNAIRTRIEPQLTARSWKMIVRPLVPDSPYESSLVCTRAPSLVDAVLTPRGERVLNRCSPGAYEVPPDSLLPDITIQAPGALQSSKLAQVPTGVRVEAGPASTGNRVTIRFSGISGPITAPAPFVEGPARTYTATLPVNARPSGWDFTVAVGYNAETGLVDSGPLTIDATMVVSDEPRATTVTDSVTVPIVEVAEYDLAVKGPSSIGRCSPLPLTYTLTNRGDLPLPLLRWDFSPGLGQDGTVTLEPDEYNTLYPDSRLQSKLNIVSDERQARWASRPFAPTETQPSLGITLVSTANVELANSANGSQLPNGALITPSVMVTQVAPDSHPVEVTGGGPIRVGPELSGLRLEVSGLDGVGAGGTATGTMSLVNTDPRRCADVTGVLASIEGLGGAPIVPPRFDLLSGGGRFVQPVTFRAPAAAGVAKVGMVLNIPGADRPVILTADVVVKPTYLALEDPADVVEGTGGTTTVVFPVTLDEASDVPITVGWASADGVATNGVDFTGGSGEITIPAGETSGEIAIPVAADAVDEGDELFAVQLVPPAGGLVASAAIAKFNAGVTILDDDTASLSVADQSVEEGSSGAAAGRDVTISLSTPTDREVALTATAAPGSADAGDFTATAATVTIPAGETSAVLPVDVLGDTTPEGDETFTVTLSGVTGAPVDDDSGVVTVVNDDAWVVDGDTTVTVAEGNRPPATTPALVTFTLNAPAPASGLVLDVRTADGTARAPGDYRARTATLTVAPGETTATVTVDVVNDLLPERTESFRVTASGLRAGTEGALLRTAFVPAALVVSQGTDAVVTVTDADVADPTTGGSGGSGDGDGGSGSDGGSGGDDGSGTGTGGATDGLGSSGANPFGAMSAGLAALVLGIVLVAFVRRRRI